MKERISDSKQTPFSTSHSFPYHKSIAPISLPPSSSLFPTSHPLWTSPSTTIHFCCNKITAFTLQTTVVDMSPPPPLANIHDNLLPHPHKLPTLPDLFLTALSVCFLFTSSTKSTISPRCPFLSFPLNPRRFLKIPAMSHSASNHKINLLSRRHNFASPQSLSEWLKTRLPSDSFASWGVKPGTKNVHNLWLELSEGETSLADSSPPVRTVQVVTVRVIGKDGKILVESHQELSDGNVRKRGRPLSEKMKPSEDPESAAIRAIKEELGSVVFGSVADLDVCEIVTIDPNSYEMKVEERNSDSYPGLPGCYVLHTLNATVEGLPEGDFCTFEVDEYEHLEGRSVADKAVSVKKHYWTWVSADSMNLDLKL